MSAWTPHDWQRERWQQLQGAVAQGRLGHAILLAGPRGAGKSHFAHGIAGYLLCESSAADKPCGECRGCVQRAAGVHPNLRLLIPAEDKRDIAIDDIRALLEGLQLSSHYGGAKVAIIDPADALNASGANALLKTVEEPPPNTYLLLVAERWRALPATLRSRCQILRLVRPRGARPLAEAPAADWAKALTEAGEGRLSALRIAYPPGKSLKREDAQRGLEAWLALGTSWLESMLRAGPGIAPPTSIGVDQVQRLLDEVVEALRALERNGNPTLLVESIMIRLSRRAPTAR